MKIKGIFRIYIFCYSFEIISNLIVKLKNLSKENNISFSGPIFLPNKLELFNILRSPHVNKDSRDQFFLFTHKSIIDFLNININFINLLRDLFFFYSLDFTFKFIIDK